ncbi:hypothetical protein QCA50_009012 [Cerrena zonata]|uniref:Uncharacterized protein n=1 Tax=Cerrena zonata TaxID=2478898 RepID=A0AAW0G380_9APHY
MSTHGYDLSSRTGFLCGNSTVSLASPKPTASFLLLEAKHQLPDLLLGRVTKDRTTSDILVRQPLHTKTQDTGGIHGPIVVRISDIPTLLPLVMS